MEGDAGASPLNPTDDTDDEDSSDEVVAQAREPIEAAALTDPAPETDPARETPVASAGSRLGGGWVVGVLAALLLLSAGVAAGGYLALHYHYQSEAFARADAAAIQAAEGCVSATHAPNTAAMTAAQQKIVDCSTGAFGAQAALYSGMLVEAYQAANVQVQVSDMRAAVEKHNDDGSIDVLVAVRVKVSNTDERDQEQGYRLRVQMTPMDGTYKIAKLDQVSS